MPTTQLTWIVDAYSLFFAALLLPAGALGDRFGRRLTLLIGLGIFGAGSAVAMTVDSAHELIALRAVLGLGAALVMPATLSTITGTFAAAERTKAVSIWAGVAGASAVLGVLASGTLLEFWSWRSVFALNVVLAAIAIIGTLRCRARVRRPGGAAARRTRRAARGRGAVRARLLDHRGADPRLDRDPDARWDSALGLVVLVGFVLFERRTPDPMLDPRVFSHRGLAAGSLSIFVQFFAFFGFIFVVLQYLQLARGDSPLVSAVSMLPMAATLMPTAGWSRGWSTAWGPRSCVRPGWCSSLRAVRHRPGRREQLLLAAAGRPAADRRGHGCRDDTRDDCDHRGAAGSAAGCRFRGQRPLP